MTPYLKTLTDEMIKQGEFEGAAQEMQEDQLRSYIEATLLSSWGPIKKYNPNTLIKILLAFGQEDPGRRVSLTFVGDGLKGVRTIVARSLAHMICARLL